MTPIFTCHILLALSTFLAHTFQDAFCLSSKAKHNVSFLSMGFMAFSFESISLALLSASACFLFLSPGFQFLLFDIPSSLFSIPPPFHLNKRLILMAFTALLVSYVLFSSISQATFV